MAAHFLNTESLKDCMNAVGVSSFRALVQQSGVSRRQVEWLRQGQVNRLSVQSALQLAATLKLSIAELLFRFGDDLPPQLNAAPLEDSAQHQRQVPLADYQRLEQVLENQRAHLLEIFQSEALNILESADGCPCRPK
jgi:transcriptional regulator with XRE-family HTH domain